MFRVGDSLAKEEERVEVEGERVIRKVCLGKGKEGG